MQETRTVRGFLLVGVVMAALATAGVATAAPEGEAARITGLVGSVKAGDEAAGQHGVLPEDGKIETQNDGNCAVLLDENALLEMCGDTSIQLTRNPGTKNRVVRVDAGEVRMVVEPRAAGERIDVVTPAAVATIMGTIINIVVDPLTGETTLSSTQSSMTVRAAEPYQQQSGSATVDAAQSITMMPGDDPAKLQVRQLDRQALAGLNDCLGDLRGAAVAQDRVLGMSKAQDRVAAADSEAINASDVALAAGVTPGSTAPAPPEPGSGPTGENAGDSGETYVSDQAIAAANAAGEAPPPFVPGVSPGAPGGPPIEMPPIEPPPPIPEPCSVPGGQCIPGGLPFGR